MPRSADEEEYLSSSLEEEEVSEEFVEEDDEEESEESEKESEEEEFEEEQEEDFYRIESITKRRVNQERVQYLLEWSRWSERTNSWEPVENLGHRPNMIEAFEDERYVRYHQRGRPGRCREHGRGRGRGSGRGRGRGRERGRGRSGGRGHGRQIASSSRAYRQQPQQWGAIPPRVPGDGIARALNRQSSSSELQDSGDLEVNSDSEEPTNVGIPVTPLIDEVVPEYGVPIPAAATVLVEPREQNPDPAEAVHRTEVVPDVVLIPGATHMPVEQTQPNPEPVEPVRLTGAKKRKAGNVARFLQALRLVENIESTGQDTSASNNVTTEPADHPVVTKIVRTVDVSTSITGNMREVTVTFLAERSDGTTGYVTNKTLMAENPILLINFYEQHLKN